MSEAELRARLRRLHLPSYVDELLVYAQREGKITIENGTVRPVRSGIEPLSKDQLRILRRL